MAEGSLIMYEGWGTDHERTYRLGLEVVKCKTDLVINGKRQIEVLRNVCIVKGDHCIEMPPIIFDFNKDHHYTEMFYRAKNLKGKLMIVHAHKGGIDQLLLDEARKNRIPFVRINNHSSSEQPSLIMF